MTDRVLLDRIEALEKSVGVLRGMLVGYQLALTSLVAKHPDPEQLKLHLAGLLEWTANGSLSKLNPADLEVARSVIDALIAVTPVTVKIDPLKGR
jgi:hypothetical protein